MRAVLLLLSLVACSGGNPSTPEDCAGISSAKSRDECYLKVAPDVFRKDPEAGIKLVESGITDPVNRDFAWYTVTKEVDPNNGKYCTRIKDSTLADRCRLIIARPHLNRDLAGPDKIPSADQRLADPSRMGEDVRGTTPPK